MTVADLRVLYPGLDLGDAAVHGDSMESWGGDKSAIVECSLGAPGWQDSLGVLRGADTDHSSPQGGSLGPQDRGVRAEVCSQDLSLPLEEQREVPHPCHGGNVQQPALMPMPLGVGQAPR